MKNFKRIGWLLVGIILCSSISVANITQSNYFIDNFFNVNEIRDCQKVYYKDYINDNNGVWKLNNQDFEIFMKFGTGSKKWKYFCINVKDMDYEEIRIGVDFMNLDIDGSVLFKEEVLLHKGKNIIKINCKDKFDSIWLRIPEDSGEFIDFESVQVRKSKPINNFKNKFVKRFIMLFLCYIVITVIFVYAKLELFLNYILDTFIGILIKLFSAFNFIALIVKKNFFKNSRSLRIGILLLLLLYFNLSSIKLFINHSNEKRVYILSLLITILSISFSSKYDNSANWKSPFMKLWVIYNIMVIISDLIVDKVLMNQGLVLLFVFGYFIFSWNNYKKKNEFIQEICMAVHIYFLLTMFCCFVFRPDIYLRYMGTFSNPVTFGSYMSLISIVSMAEISNIIIKNKRSKYIVFYIFELIESFFMIFKTQSRSALLPSLIVLIILISIIKSKNNRHYYRGFVVATIIAIFLFQFSNKMLNYLPIKLNTTVQFENDIYKESDKNVLKNMSGISDFKKSNVYAMDNTNKIYLLEKIKFESIEDLTSGRNLYWKAYFRNMNLFGHWGYLRVNGKRVHPHNSFVLVAYRYGVFTVVPYICLIFQMLIFSIFYFKNNINNHNKYYITFPIYLSILFMSVSFLDVAEYLYSGFIWTIFNMSMLMMNNKE